MSNKHMTTKEQWHMKQALYVSRNALELIAGFDCKGGDRMLSAIVTIARTALRTVESLIDDWHSCDDPDCPWCQEDG